MRRLSSKALLSAVESYMSAPIQSNRDALIAAADEYHELWVLEHSVASTSAPKYGTSVAVTPKKQKKFDLSRIMDDLQITST